MDSKQVVNAEIVRDAVNRAVAAEREACAREACAMIADIQAAHGDNDTCAKLLELVCVIRARGAK